jgi:hypothetical protein
VGPRPPRGAPARLPASPSSRALTVADAQFGREHRMAIRAVREAFVTDTPMQGPPPPPPPQRARSVSAWPHRGGVVGPDAAAAPGRRARAPVLRRDPGRGTPRSCPPSHLIALPPLPPPPAPGLRAG